jgi:hypothetical protein
MHATPGPGHDAWNPLMLDDMRVLRDAAQAYRAAATAAGLVWPEPADTQVPDLDLVYRLFDVDHVPEQLNWLESQGWDSGTPFPNRGHLLSWPTNDDTARHSLNMLSFAVATPFHWRHQIPMFYFSGDVVYTFVLEGDHEGEIWRYLISPDLWDPVRAAPSLAALFTEWTKAITAGVLYLERGNYLLVVEDSGIPRAFDVLRQRAPDVDPFAFPDDIPEPVMRERQRECGVDLDCIDRGFECKEELLDDILAVRASLGL